MLRWLKSSMPQNLYARAALILLVPVVTLQLAVTIAFLQRHFEDVTRQLTKGVVLEANLVLTALVRSREEGERLAKGLDMDLSLPQRAPASSRVFFDVSGITMLATLDQNMPEFVSADLASNARRVVIYLDGPAGPVSLGFDRQRVSASNPHQLLVITVLVSFVMTVVAYAFLRNQLRPIKRLSAAAEAFGKGRQVPYTPAGALEVQAAGRAFLDMRARIERQIEQRTMMLSGVSHDLRTPLTRMKLELSLLDPGPEVDALARDLDEMEELMEAFLDFSQSEAMEERDEFDPVRLVSDVVEKARHGDKGVVLHVSDRLSRPDQPPFSVRVLSVQRALANLIGNALRYGTNAEVTLGASDTHLSICVEDDGPGIPEDRYGEALRPFSRLDQARNQDRGSGVGLGLAIAADVARSHGGALVLGRSKRLGGLSAELTLAR